MHQERRRQVAATSIARLTFLTVGSRRGGWLQALLLQSRSERDRESAEQVLWRFGSRKIAPAPVHADQRLPDQRDELRGFGSGHEGRTRDRQHVREHCELRPAAATVSEQAAESLRYDRLQQNDCSLEFHQSQERQRGFEENAPQLHDKRAVGTAQAQLVSE